MSESVNLGGWLFTQTALLFAVYGLDYVLPWWVQWFPSIIALPLMLIVGGLMAVLVSAVKR
jgi:uncharacterized integral membrane protein